MTGKATAFVVLSALLVVLSACTAPGGAYDEDFGAADAGRRAMQAWDARAAVDYGPFPFLPGLQIPEGESERREAGRPADSVWPPPGSDTRPPERTDRPWQAPGGSCESHASADGSVWILPFEIAAAAEGAGLFVSVPVHSSGRAQQEVKVEVVLTSVSGEPYGYASAQTLLLEGAIQLAEVGIEMPGELETPVQRALVNLAVRVSPKSGDWELYVVRSMLELLPMAELIIIEPGEVYPAELLPVRLLARERGSGLPLAGAFVAVTVNPPVGGSVQLSGLVGEDGSLVVELPALLPGTHHVTAAMEHAGGTVEVESAFQVVPGPLVFVTTDKPLYQPGQTVHVRALALERPDMAPMAGEEITLEVIDSAGNKVMKSTGPADEYGIVAAGLPLADMVLLGEYTVRAVVGDELFERHVKVARYALPKFKVTAEIDATYCDPGKAVSGSVSAVYTFGEPVAGALVKVTAQALSEEPTILATEPGTLDEEGAFHFSLQLPATAGSVPLALFASQVEFVVSVTDSAEHEEKASLVLPVAAAPLDLQLVSESGALVPGVENRLYLLVTDPGGQPAAASFVLHLEGASPEVLDGATDEWGFAELEILPAGPVTAELTVVAGDGQPVSRTFELFASFAETQVLVRTDKAVYEVGEDMAVTVLSPVPAGAVFLDVSSRGRLEQTLSLDLADGFAATTIPLTEELDGDVVLRAALPGKLHMGFDHRLAYVRPARRLDVAVVADKDTYQPADQAALLLQVTDEEGKPKAAAVGVTVVDEAVYALQDVKPGQMEAFFHLPEWLTAAGSSPSGAAALVGYGNDETGLQQLHAVSFAGLAADGAAAVASSLAQHAAEVKEVVHPLMLAELMQTSLDLWEYVDWDNLESLFAVDTMKKIIADYQICDPWGNLYLAEGSQGVAFALVSMGPDEVAGTWDDIEVNLWEDLGWWLPGSGGSVQLFMGGSDGSDIPDSWPDEPGPLPTSDPQVRRYFPETLLVEPALITGPDGLAELPVPLADSITQWRLTAIANAADGRLGSASAAIPVFQELFIDVDFPATLTRNDEVTFPVAVYNYLDAPQAVTVTVEPAGWFTLYGSASQVVQLGPGEVGVAKFPVRVDEAGWQTLTVTGYGQGAADATARTVEVVPDGQLHEESLSALLDGESILQVTCPPDAIPGSQQLYVKLYPGLLSQVVEGLDCLLKEPYG